MLQNGVTPMHMAAYGGKTKVLVLLLAQEQVNVNVQDEVMKWLGVVLASMD